jgi:hypothetical protein
MILPNTVKYEAVSTTANPVTHVAEVAVNMESVHDNDSNLLFSEIRRKREPNKITSIKKIIGKTIGEFIVLDIFIQS